MKFTHLGIYFSVDELSCKICRYEINQIKEHRTRQSTWTQGTKWVYYLITKSKRDNISTRGVANGNHAKVTE